MRERNPHGRYEVCKDCGRKWNVSIGQKIPLGGYLCPHCAAKYKALREKIRRTDT